MALETLKDVKKKAVDALDRRTSRRLRQGIEGTDQEHRPDSDGHE